MTDIELRIKKLRDLMLIHSYIYYENNDSLVSDDTWQKWANELRDLQKVHGVWFGHYDDAFRDWDGTTGHHLKYNAWVVQKAQQLMRYRDDNKMDYIRNSNNS